VAVAGRWTVIASSGVAHKRLPCGTQVAVLYKGRRITVPVVDRGPFAHGAQWDLTAATAQALGFEHTDRVGAVRVAAVS
jgi:rare lipoprotein A